MHNKNRSFIVSIIFTVTILFNTHAQIAISNLDRIPQLKSGTTYVAMKDPNAPGVKEYIDMFKKNWTISKIEFIKYSDVHYHYAPGNYFLTVGGYKFDEQYTPMFGGFFGGSDGKTNDYPNGAWFKETHIYLELWTCTDKFYEKKDKELYMNNTVQVARIELATDVPAYDDPKNLYAEEYNSTLRIRNWGIGILENYVQSMMAYFTKAQERKLYAPITNTAELAKLKTATLYVPDYVLIQFDKKTEDETKKHDESELFKKYTLKHTVLSNQELNAKISNKSEPIYYLIYVKSRADKFVYVINSLTGEIIYSRYAPMSFNINPDDLGALQSEISK